MNERIRQLAEQAVKAVDNPFPGNPLNDELAKMYIPDCFAEKFAELIVRKCVDIAKHNIYEPDYRGGSQILESFENYQANRRAEDILNQIQKHFGVEE
jgi:hypothetical protein